MYDQTTLFLPLSGMQILIYTGIYADVCTFKCVNIAL